MDEKIVKDSQGLAKELVNDCISRQAAIEAIDEIINRFEQILRDIRETKVDDSVCGMCEYDGAYIGQSGDWCNECPGFEKDDCFKLSEACRKRWLESVGLPSAQPEKRTDKHTETHASDLISRQMLLEYIHGEPVGKLLCDKYNLDGLIEQFPSAQPEQRWIPCGERLPEYEKEVLVTRHFLSDNQLKKNAITESFYVEVASRMDDEWTSYSDDYKIKKHLHKVIAWMPLPEPYKEDNNG